MNEEDRIIQWLMRGDPAIQYQAARVFLHESKQELNARQHQIESKGWGSRFLKKQHKNGHWGITFYQPKWTSTHYTLLDLKTICLPPSNPQAQRSTGMVLGQQEGIYGGINLAETLHTSDVCVNGMILNYSSYFLPDHPRLKLVIDYLLNVQMADGGWNCRYLVKGTSHSSMHSTLSVLEGLLQFQNSNDYRKDDIVQAETRAKEFLLFHRLFRSHRTGNIIDHRMLKMSFPCRWKYDILRALEYFTSCNHSYDERMEDALKIIRSKQRKDGKWNLSSPHPGQVHFQMEKAGMPSRWNTLRASKVLRHYS